MVPLLNRPFLEHALTRLKSHGVTEAFLAVGYLAQQIQDHFGDGGGVGLTLHYGQEARPLGTAGAVKLVAPSLRGTFLVCNGDVFTDLDISAMLAFHREKRAKATIFLTSVENPSAFGVVEVDSQGRVKRFIEKPPPDRVTSHWINGGAYLLEPEVLDEVPPGDFSMFEYDLFPRLVEMGASVYGYQARPYWLDMGTTYSYLKLHQDLLLGRISVGALSSENPERVWRGPACRVDATAVLEGPLMLGDGCVIEAGARVLGPTVLGEGCRIAAGASVRGSVIWADTTIGPEAILEECIVGRKVSLGPRVLVGPGCVVADGVQVGEGNRLERGIALWPNKVLQPSSVAFMP